MEITIFINVSVGLTKKFYDTMMKFCFPERDPENIEGDGPDESESGSGSGSSKRSKGSDKAVKKGKDSSFYVCIEHKDDVEKMKVNLQNNYA